VGILLVEDDDNLRNLLQRTLEGKGFAVVASADGTEALRLCDGTTDLVVSDIVMPRLNGLELWERIRKVRPETKFLFITGFRDDFPELNELINLGARVLEKPFLPSELLRSVEDTLNQANEPRATGERAKLRG
jgi:DNA-binding response OmpR family regulator